MWRPKMLFLLYCLLLGGCSLLNKNPDILLKAPYNRVTYITNPDATHEVQEVVEITTKGVAANILNTIPRLYLKAIEVSGKEKVELGNLRITSYTRQEEVEVPIRECYPYFRTRSMPHKVCSGGSCTEDSSWNYQDQDRCLYNFRTEIQDVLYQNAKADILVKKQ